MSRKTLIAYIEQVEFEARENGLVEFRIKFRDWAPKMRYITKKGVHASQVPKFQDVAKIEYKMDRILSFENLSVAQDS